MGGWTYNSGQFNLYCDVCAKKIKAEESKHRWDGLIVCADDWEERQPQDFVKARTDKITIPFSRPVEDTPFKIPLGFQDVVKITESGTLVSAIYAPIYNDVVRIQDYFTIKRALIFNELVNTTESYSDTTNFNFDETVHVSLKETGAVCILDYVDTSYFEELYVGTCEYLPTILFYDTVNVSNYGVVTTDPYVDADYFDQDYVGTSFLFLN